MKETDEVGSKNLLGRWVGFRPAGWWKIAVSARRRMD
jgi:hypothetical protein